MHPKNLSEPARFADQPSFHDRPLPFDLGTAEATFELTKRAALIIIFTLSLGLWAVMWAALASLASASLG